MRERSMDRENDRLTRRLRMVVQGIILLILAGALGYMILEGWGFTDALYMTVITLSTVGFGEIQPLSPVGRLFTVILIVVGVGAAAYMFSSLAEYIVAGELRGTLQRRRMQRTINDFDAHYVVCGFGRVGQQVAQELEANGAQVVIVDRDATRLDYDTHPDQLFILGDASDDEVLKRAGISRAKGLVAATGSDAENVYITLTARALKRDLIIVVRGIMPDSEPKLRKAGADHVILPHAIGGRRMAGMLMRPTVVDFLDVVMHSEDLELWLEDIVVSAGCRLADSTLGKAQVRSRTGANILAIKTADGQLLTNVAAENQLHAGDVMVALGTRQQLRELDALASGQKPAID